jgi:antitoxin YefM
MHTTYRLNASELDQGFLDALKATFQGKEIEIVVYEVDETLNIAYRLE